VIDTPFGADYVIRHDRDNCVGSEADIVTTWYF